MKSFKIIFTFAMVFLGFNAAFAVSDTDTCNSAVRNELSVRGYAVVNLALKSKDQNESVYDLEGFYQQGYGLDEVTVDNNTCSIRKIESVWAE